MLFQYQGTGVLHSGLWAVRLVFQPADHSFQQI